MGRRLASEVLMLDKPLTAQEAVACGFANGVIDGLGDSDWFDMAKVPAIGKLANTDYRTLLNCQKMLNDAQHNAKIDEVMKVEAINLVDSWLDEDFPPKLASYMMKVM